MIVDIYNGSGLGCGADLGVKIKIQKPDRAYCSVPLPAFSYGDTMTREGSNLGDCRFVDFDVGLDSIPFWIYSTEKACVNSLTLRFSTPQGQVTFMAGGLGYFSYSPTAKQIYSVKNKSRKFKENNVLVTPRTTDVQRGNSLHCTAENSILIPNF